MPGVGVRTARIPASAAASIASVSRSQSTSMWSLMKPSGTIAIGLDAGGGQLGDDVVDVGLEPRLRRRARPRLEDELPADAGRVRPFAGDLAHHVGRDRPMLRGVGAALAEVDVAGAGAHRVVGGNAVGREEHADLLRAHTLGDEPRDSVADAIHEGLDEAGVVEELADLVDRHRAGETRVA